jgi:type I restriction enzyme M protein
MPRPPSASSSSARGYLKAIIGLPANLFYGTGIPACIVVLDKENASRPQGHLHDRCLQGLHQGRPKNRLREQDIHKIVDTFTRLDRNPRATPAWCRSRKSPIRRTTSTSTSRATSTAPSRRICRTSTATCAAASPTATLMRSKTYWKVFPAVRATLFKEGRPPRLHPAPGAHRRGEAAIFGHAEFTASKSATKLFAKWKKANVPRSKASPRRQAQGAHRTTLSEDLLATFEKARLLDAYDVYQHLMDYWAETMQDDVLPHRRRLARSAKPRLRSRTRKRKLVWEKHDFTVGKRRLKSDLIPPRWSSPATLPPSEQAAIEKLEAEVAAIEQALEEMAEEHGGEDGLLEEVIEERQGQAHQDPRQSREGAAERNRATPTRGRAPGAERLPRPARKAADATSAKVKATRRKRCCSRSRRSMAS